MTDFRAQEEVKNRIREVTDIVRLIGEHVELKKAGASFLGLCPFHSEKTPSFSVNPARQFFHCFGCGESGDVFSFMMKFHRLSFPEALRELADRAGIELPRRSLSEAEKKAVRERELLYRVNEAAARFYQKWLDSSWGEEARAYLAKRRIPAEAIRRYRLGCAPHPDQGGWRCLFDALRRQGMAPETMERAGLVVRRENGGWYDRFRNRIMFPILDLSGRVVAFGGRILDDSRPKYMNSPESPIFDKSRLLFGLGQHKEAIRTRGRALVVEGNFDLLSLAAAGIEEVVAPLGTALTRGHVRSLRGYCSEVILLFDGDEAGLKAAMRAVPFFLSEQVDARVALLPGGEDPDSLVRSRGRAAVDELLDQARELPEFVFGTLVRRHGLTLSGKNRIIEELQPLFAAAADRQRALLAAHFSEKLGLPPNRLMGSSRPVSRHRPSSGSAPASTLFQLSRRERQLVDFLLLYPGYLPALLEAGLMDVVADEQVRALIGVLEPLSAQGDSNPEIVFTALRDEDARRYAAELFARVREQAPGEEDEAEQMCREVIGWILLEKEQKNEADLMRQIMEAQQAGDQEMLMELLRRKQEQGRKRTEFYDNMLKK